MTEREACLALNLLPGLGPIRIRRLIARFGSAGAVLTASRDALRAEHGVGHEVASAVAGWEQRIDLGRELRRIREIGAHIVTEEDAAFPAPLREAPDAPVLLYVHGRLEERDRHAVSVVGSRRTTHYGITTARKLAFQLARAGLTVVSGLARGIDTAAHEAAVAAHGRTVAVLGSGLGQLYPSENRALADRIADGHGAVVTEFPVDYPPDRQSFPLRNRIVAAWGHGVLVVEAPRRSGALITAEQALDYSRTIYAVPGPVDRPTAEGPNRLIQRGARLVIDAGDILDDLSQLFQPALFEPAPEPARPTLDGDEDTVYGALGEEESTIDELISRTGLTSSIVSTTLLRLEMKRLVKPLPGARFVKLV